MTKLELEHRIDQPSELSFGDIFEKTIDLFKKVWLQGLLKNLLFFALVMGIMLIGYVPLVMILAFFGIAAESMSSDASAVVALPMVLLMIIFMVIMAIAFFAINIALTASFFRICKMKDQGQIGRDDYFYYLKRPYFRKLLGLSAATIVIGFFAAILCYLPLIYAIVPLSFFSIVFAFNPELTVSEIVSVSFKLGTKKWGITFLLLAVIWLVSYMISIFTCGLGSLFLQAILHLPIYFVYKQVIGFDDEDEVDFIGIPATL